MWRVLFRKEISTDLEAPVISSITQSNVAVSNEWATGKKIKITGTENYCNSVKIKMVDSEGVVYLNNVSASVNNNAYSYEFIPDIEANESGKVFTITVTDNLGNSASKSITVYKTDKKPPTLLNMEKYNSEWTKNKEITFNAKDSGVGNVSIAFNNASDYSLATKSNDNYSRTYNFIGDVYGTVKGTVYIKDSLNNESMGQVEIGKLDNTAPTITTATLSNNIVNINAHDRHSTLRRRFRSSKIQIYNK